VNSAQDLTGLASSNSLRSSTAGFTSLNKLTPIGVTSAGGGWTYCSTEAVTQHPVAASDAKMTSEGQSTTPSLSASSISHNTPPIFSQISTASGSNTQSLQNSVQRNVFNPSSQFIAPSNSFSLDGGQFQQISSPSSAQYSNQSTRPVVPLFSAASQVRPNQHTVSQSALQSGSIQSQSSLKQSALSPFPNPNSSFSHINQSSVLSMKTDHVSVPVQKPNSEEDGYGKFTNLFCS
jgi:hypothetical protein